MGQQGARDLLLLQPALLLPSPPPPPPCHIFIQNLNPAQKLSLLFLLNTTATATITSGSLPQLPLLLVPQLPTQPLPHLPQLPQNCGKLVEVIVINCDLFTICNVSVHVSTCK